MAQRAFASSDLSAISSFMYALVALIGGGPFGASPSLHAESATCMKECPIRFSSARKIVLGRRASIALHGGLLLC